MNVKFKDGICKCNYPEALPIGTTIIVEDGRLIEGIITDQPVTCSNEYEIVGILDQSARIEYDVKLARLEELKEIGKSNSELISLFKGLTQEQKAEYINLKEELS